MRKFQIISISPEAKRAAFEATQSLTNGSAYLRSASRGAPDTPFHLKTLVTKYAEIAAQKAINSHNGVAK